MAIKLIALDLDGTLLTSQKTISPKNKEALHWALQQGIYVVLTTGRPLPAIGGFLEELGLDGAGQYSITFNGGLVQENTGTILDKVGFHKSDVERIYQVTQELGLPLDVLYGGEVYSLTAERPSLYLTCNPLLQARPSTFAELPEDLVYNKAVSATDAAFLDQQMTHLPQEIYQSFEVFKSRDILLEWSPKGVHKAAGLSKLIAHLGIDQSEVMACGDEENDRSMLEWAGLGVAMGNATEAIKQIADTVLPVTNDEDGIAWTIAHYLERKDGYGII